MSYNYNSVLRYTRSSFMHRTRKGLTSQQEEYIERITKPKTPEDVVLALQNPLSAIYKDALNMLIAQIQIDIIIEKLIQHYLLHEFQAKEQEKEELIKAMILMEAKRNIHRDVLQIPEMIQYKKTIENLDLSKMKQQWEKHSALVTALESQVASLENDLSEIREREIQVNQEWRQAAEETRAVYVENLNRQNLVFIGADGNAVPVNSELGQRVINLRCGLESPTPLQVLSSVAASVQEIRETNYAETASWVRDIPTDPRMANAMNAIANQLKAYTELVINTNGNPQKDLYTVSVNNNKQMSAELMVSQTVQQPASPSSQQPESQTADESEVTKKVITVRRAGKQRVFTVQQTAESRYQKSLLEESKKHPDEKIDIVLLDKELTKTKTGYLAELNQLGAEAEGKTGPELLQAIRKQKQMKLQPGGPAKAADKMQALDDDNKPKLAAAAVVVHQAVVMNTQENIMSDTLTLINRRAEAKNKLHQTNTNLEFAKKQVDEDEKRINVIISQNRSHEHDAPNMKNSNKGGK